MAALFACLWGCQATGPLQTGVPPARELQRRLEALDQRLERVEARVRALEHRLARRREEAPPESPFKPAPPSRRETPSAPKAEAAPPSPPSPLEAGGPEQLYAVATACFGRGDWAGARRALQEFLRRYPEHERVPDALYWIGETYFREGKYAEAVEVYERIIREHPQHRWAPYAMLKEGLAFHRMGDQESAEITLNKVRELYPHTPQARMAGWKLAEWQRARTPQRPEQPPAQATGEPAGAGPSPPSPRPEP